MKHRNELIGEITESVLSHTKHGVDRAVVSAVISAYIDMVFAELRSGNEVNLFDIGKIVLSVRKARPARVGRNPKTGQAVNVPEKPEKRTARLRASKALKEVLNSTAN